MRLLSAVIYKEYLQLIRNRTLLFLVIVAPVVVLGVIPLSFEGNTSYRAGVCYGEGEYDFVERVNVLRASSLFEEVVYYPDYEAAEDEMLRGRLDVIVMNSSEGVHFLTDGTFPRRALDVLYVSDKLMYGESVPAEFQILFNAGRRYNHYYLVSLIILVVTLVGTALITLNIVRERENGVEEQLHCAVINHLVYFGGKYVFFMMLSLLQVMLCYLFCNVVYGLESGGLFVDYMGVIFVSLFPLLGLGYVIASFSENQLQAVYLLTIVLVLATMLSTMFTHLSSMPCWAASLRYINPVYYAVEGSRMILLKGGSILDAGTLLLHMMFLGVLFFGIFFLKISRRF